jgi:hypothetical protein
VALFQKGLDLKGEHREEDYNRGGDTSETFGDIQDSQDSAVDFSGCIILNQIKSEIAIL